MKKILVISWYFPPVNSSEGLVTFKLLKNSKLSYDVFTQKKSDDWAYNNTENKLISKNITPIFSECKDISSWIDDGINYFEKNREKYDVIMTRSMAPESHEIGLAIKKKYPEVKWIASFGDPITNNPYQEFYKPEFPYEIKGRGILDVGIKYALSPKRILKNMYSKYRHHRYIRKYTRIAKDNILQGQVFEYADKIILNSEEQRDFMLNGYKDDVISKTIVLPHTFDENFYDYSLDNNNKKIVMSYIGHCDNIRTPKNLFDTIKRLKEEEPNLNKKLEVNFYGNLSINDKALIIDNCITDIINVNQPVSYFESLDIMRKSNWLILIDANLGKVMDKNIFFAAKLVDYLGSKRPIFGITMYDGPSANILRETNNVLSSFSVDEIYMHLKMILLNKHIPSEYDNSKFNAKKVAKDFDKMVNELL